MKFIELNEDKKPKTNFDVTSSTLNNFENTGLLLNNKVVVIDFDNDNKNENEIMNYFEKSFPTLIVKTNRGKHFYYSKPDNVKIKLSSDQITLGGFQVDYRTGNKSYVVVKQNGIIRETNQELRLDNLPELPSLMYPLKKAENITGFKDGDGRNDKMFHHLLLVRIQYGDNDIDNIADFINNNIFSDKLDIKELSSIIESVSSYEITTNKEKEGWMDMAETVINELQCVYFENDIMFFDENINYYSTNLKKIEHFIQMKYRESANFTIGGIKEVIKQMAVILSNNNKKYSRDDTYILCGKELVNTKSNEVMANTRTIITDVIYQHSIMSNEELEEYEKEKKIAWKFLEDISCSNVEVKQVICECLGCMLAPSNIFGKIFIWYGNGANGKSVLVKVMKAIMGDLLTNANILNINDRFGLSRAFKGIANVTDDVGITTIKETGLLKSIVDGSSIEVDRKYNDPIDWVPNSQFVMCCNDIPRIQDTTKGMMRRLSFIPFDLQLKENEIDYELTNKLLGKSKNLNENDKNDNALRYIMTKAIFAYREAIDRGHLTTLEKQKSLLSEFEEENKDTISLFYDFLIEREGNLDQLCKWLDGRTIAEVYDDYRNFRGIEVIETQRSFAVKFNRKLPNKIEVMRKTISGLTITAYCLH